MSSLVSLAHRRLRMLGDEAVPCADSVLAALAKHLEVKLAFGATGTQMKAKLKGWTLINPLWFWVQIRMRETWLSSGMTSASDIPLGSWRPNTSAWSCMATRTASPPWPRLWDTQQPLLLACCWMVNLLKYQFVLTFVILLLVYVACVNVWTKCYHANTNLCFTFFFRWNHEKRTRGSDDKRDLWTGADDAEGGGASLPVFEHTAGLRACVLIDLNNWRVALPSMWA